MIVSAFASSTMSAFVKVAGPLSTGQIVFARAIVMLAISYMMVRRAGLAALGNQPRKLILRGALGFSSLSFSYISIARLPLADALTLQQTTPLFTVIAAWWILDERVSWSTAIALICGLGGVLLVVRPQADAVDLIGVAAALCGACLSAAAYVTVRELSRSENPLVIVMYFSLTMTPLALPWAAATWVAPDTSGWLLLLAIGAGTQIGQVFLTKALAIEAAGRVATMGYLQICFAILWQFSLFGIWPSFGTLTGAALIIAGTLAVSMQPRGETQTQQRVEAKR